MRKIDVTNKVLESASGFTKMLVTGFVFEFLDYVSRCTYLLEIVIVTWRKCNPNGMAVDAWPGHLVSLNKLGVILQQAIPKSL